MRVGVKPVLLACCAVEAATAVHRPVERDDMTWILDDGDRDVTVVVIAGTITHANRDVVHGAIDSTPDPKAVVAYGVCASSGGPYWDSPSVVQGWPTAHLFVPGCPPPPPVFWSAVAAAAQQAVAHAAH